MRLDLVIEEDMAEEIGRIMGYDKVKPELPKINFTPKQNEVYQKMLWARSKLLADGYSEVMTTSFRDKGEVSVLASASDKNFLRFNLSDGLKESIKLNQTNAPLLGENETKVFEMGTVFTKNGEEMRVAYGNKKEVKEVSLMEFCEKAGAELFPSGPRKQSPDSSEKNPVPAFKAWSLFPFIARDVAVWVPDGVTSENVKKIIDDNKGDMVVRGPELFDEFKKGDKISYAFRLVFQSFERTLTDAEVAEVMIKIQTKITDKGWQVR
jgi:phenylalanyl-tRNA synthetase beta subunit